MRIIRSIRLFCKINWLRTIYFNFKNLPFKQAIHLPILLYHPGRIDGYGTWVLDVKNEMVKFGMLKLGVKNENSILTQTGISISNFGKIIFKGSGVIGNGVSLTIGKNAILSVGKNFGITGNVTIHCFEKITIGNFFSCSWNVSIDDTDHHKLFDMEKNIEKRETKPIIIGDNVWLCQNVTVLKGSQLSDWTIVSSNSLVNKEFHVSPYSVLAGTPARDTGKKIKRVDIDGLISRPNWNITEGLKTFNC